MGQTKASSGIKDTQAGRASDAAIVKVNEKKALAITSDCNPHYCFADPHEGGKQIVAESYRNLCASGATPKAVTNNLNFGNPERPEIMHQFVGCLDGLGEACHVLEYPVISGNVSLYNETNGKGILPTPVIGGVGLIDDIDLSMDMAFKNDGEAVYILGQNDDTSGHMGQSLYAREIEQKKGNEGGKPPSVDLEKEKVHGLFVLKLIREKIITACHDISDGGSICALTEMCMAGNRGVKINTAKGLSFWFGEDQGRYVISTNHPETLENLAKEENIPLVQIGSVHGSHMQLNEATQISIDELKSLHEDWLPNYMILRKE